MSEFYTDDLRLKCVLSRDDADWSKPGKSAWRTAAEVEVYLNADPRHAVLLFGGKDEIFGTLKYEPALYILRGASEGLDNFYWGTLPAEDPNDAEGGDLAADQAIGQAAGEYHQ